ncbi:hypothetical protein SDC9_178626 [bioreactor metagenome]|uniref:DUF2508 domain-containing protein n=1 Tax=bioreactor metagenome TaxID=1076179 RepID=A0A645GYM6_9ZZZZ
MKLWDSNGIDEELEREGLKTEQNNPEAPKMRRKSILARIRDWMFYAEAAHVVSTVSRTEREQIAAALKQWKDATRYFENVSDPDLIEFAIYEMEASKRRYLCLLKRAQKLEA